MGRAKWKKFQQLTEMVKLFSHATDLCRNTSQYIRSFQFQDKRWNVRGCEVWKYLWNTVNSWPLFIPGYSLSLRLFVLIRQSWKVNNERMQIKAFTMPEWIVWLSWKKCGHLYIDTAPPWEKHTNYKAASAYSGPKPLIFSLWLSSSFPVE